jgi:hypothetical protein
LVPSPLKDPEKDPVNEPLSVSKVSNLVSNELDTLVYEDVNELKLLRILEDSLFNAPIVINVDEVNEFNEPV